ncbi:hypothetical protein BS50DRAFT_165573 [Corynespora cassiicola Philippines]|uniref:Uncharacterized protein n=1 Tax=Corynespora cassiicola Philippines TaxID=1448308 RepID=A0A2T2P527_CORCC|nr:hypothetical protein BS50DRAFT_165573 [Corynespora cassiicola Philippines]
MSLSGCGAVSWLSRFGLARLAETSARRWAAWHGRCAVTRLIWRAQHVDRMRVTKKCWLTTNRVFHTGGNSSWFLEAY